MLCFAVFVIYIFALRYVRLTWLCQFQELMNNIFVCRGSCGFNTEHGLFGRMLYAAGNRPIGYLVCADLF